MKVDGVQREFIVYVPTRYDATQSTPMVLVIHGTNQTGEKMYQNTLWVDKAEMENFIAIFPTSWKYPLIDEIGVHTKWNDLTLHRLAEPGTPLMDDVKFIRELVTLLKASFNVDPTRCYATGFSNGGQFVFSRLLLEMNDVFAAFGVSGSGTLLNSQDLAAKAPPNIPTSVFSIMGANDNKVAENTGHALPLPLDPQTIQADSLIGPMLEDTASLLQLDPAAYQATQEPGYTRLLYDHSIIGADNEFVFMMVKNMVHVYPDPDNNHFGINAVDLFWDFFMKHPRK